MLTLSEVQQRNRDIADKLAAEARQDPNSHLEKKYVGIANGMVVAKSDDLEELMCQLEQIEPDAQRTFIAEPGEDLSEVHEIWEMR